jgi:S1-C subfamily serine protease
MSATLMPHPSEPDTGGDREAPPPRPDRAGVGGRRPGRRPFAALLVAALLGGSVSTGLLAATGSLHSAPATSTTVVQAAATGSTGLNANAVYAAASPGVVDITATGTTQTGPFGGASQSAATGSGFEVDGQGHIVTAAHVVDGASAIKVTFADGTTRTATLSGKDDATDVAVLKVNPSGLTLHPLKLGSSSALKVGDSVAAIGTPFGYAESFSTGIVSGLDRTIDAPNGFTVAHAVQTDAAINPGNSGGPILNASGSVIGIADQIATDGSSKQSSGVGFAVPIDLIASELHGLEAGNAVKHAYLGVATSSTATTVGAPLSSVQSGGPAAAAGLRAGDVVTSIAGKPVTGSGDVVAIIAAHQPGDQVAVTYRRGGSTHTATVTLGTQPAKAASAPATP